MTPAEIREEIIDILEDISPDEDLDDLKDDVAFREQLELDSMDFLDIVMELRKRHRVQIPEEDYGALASMSSTVEYLEPKMRDIVKS
ncbi:MULTISPECIES: acyl carrier protein [Pirellulaceae]|uniref:Acyl carrier protein n=1 Tax=Roseiconus lacunae TaxID=2605694 RepID=A0ABT7PM78_9BACT|nr:MULTISPECIES: acyl carrier protein [Pirellulaceae]PNY37688.1 acyl carrier protein [Rhodopirellula baltica]WRQ51115.1 acyl carrier protein [Stieleria sp. HD01]MCD0461544.1 acyl carrier protein [Roseiconus lacunae]MDM4017622.1 acyl carrier protein [Roseiconus lacunae]OYP32220.1 acyl carrier protein [Rhodopirellula sp. MGV]